MVYNLHVFNEYHIVHIRQIYKEEELWSTRKTLFTTAKNIDLPFL